MVLKDVSKDASAAQPAEAAARGATSTLFSSAIHLREVPRDAIGDTFDGVPKFIGTLIGASMLFSLPILMYIYVIAGSKTVGFVIGLSIFLCALSLFTCAVGGGLFSYFNSRIAGCKHGWREYQIFMSGTVLVLLMRMVILASLIIGVPLLGLLAIFSTVIAAGYYTSLNYRFKLEGEGAWKIIHQIYATITLAIIMLYI